MGDVNTPAVPPVTAPDPKTVTAAPGTAPLDPAKYVTIEQHNDLLRRLDGISGSLRKLEPLATVVAPPPTPKEPDTLKSLKEQIEADRAKITARELNAALTEGLERAGVPAERRSRAAKYIKAEHGAKMAQADDGSFQYTENGEAQALSDWIALYLKTDDGKFINPEPAPSVPTAKGLAGSGKNGSASTGEHPGRKLTYKQLMDGNPAVRASFIEKHPDEWAAKEQEYYAAK